MKCTPVRFGDGTVAVVCSRAQSPLRKLCQCGRVATLECDYPNPRRRSGTCDARLCWHCAKHMAPNVDHCPDPTHPTFSELPAQLGLKL